MKKVIISLYQFNELADPAKEKALESMRYTNMGPEWWDFIYTDFINIAASIGVVVNEKKIVFMAFIHKAVEAVLLLR